MSETTNYGLYISDDNTERFIDWRGKINGEADSNMTKIDAALGGKADHSKTEQAVLLASGWTGETAPYYQVLAIEGLGAEQNGNIYLSPSASSEQKESARKAVLSLGVQAEGSLTIICDGVKPEIDIPVSVTLID